MDSNELDQHGHALAKRLVDNGARLREHLIGWLGRQGLSTTEAEAVVAHALAKGWIAQLEGTQVIIPAPPSLRG